MVRRAARTSPSGYAVSLGRDVQFVFKYVLLKHADCGAVGEVLSADFNRMPEL